MDAKAVNKQVELDIVLQPIRIINSSSARDGKKVFITWRRGLKKQNAGESEHIQCSNKSGQWGVTAKNEMKFHCTFKATRTGYEEKKLALTLREEINSKKSSLIGNAVIKLNEYAKDKINDTIQINFESSKDSPIIEFQIKTSNLQTKIVKSSQFNQMIENKKKNFIKLFYEISFEKIENLSKNLPMDSEIYIKWERGSKKQNQGKSSELKVKRGINEFPKNEEPLKIVCSLKKKSNETFSAKKISFHLISVQNKKTKIIGKLFINLADYIMHGGEKTVSLPFTSKSSTSELLTLKIKANYLQIDGKKVLADSKKSNAAGKQEGNAQNINLHGQIVQLSSQVDESSELSETANDSDELKTDVDEIEEIDDSLQDEILFLIENNHFLSNKNIENPQQIEQQMEENKKQLVKLSDELNAKRLENKKKNQFLIEIHSDFSITEEITGLLEEIERLENEKIKDQETKIQFEIEFENLKFQNENLIKTQQNLSKEMQEKAPAIEKIKTQMKSYQQEINQLKDQNKSLKNFLDDYKQLDSLKNQKNVANSVALFEEYLKLQKSIAKKYHKQKESVEEYFDLLKEEKKHLLQQIRDADSLLAHFARNPISKFKKKIHFLRKQFLLEAHNYDSDSHEPICTQKILQFIDENQIEPDFIMEILMMVQLMCKNCGMFFIFFLSSFLLFSFPSFLPLSLPPSFLSLSSSFLPLSFFFLPSSLFLPLTSSLFLLPLRSSSHFLLPPSSFFLSLPLPSSSSLPSYQSFISRDELSAALSPPFLLFPSSLLLSQRFSFFLSPLSFPPNFSLFLLLFPAFCILSVTFSVLSVGLAG